MEKGKSGILKESVEFPQFGGVGAFQGLGLRPHWLDRHILLQLTTDFSLLVFIHIILWPPFKAPFIPYAKS